MNEEWGPFLTIHIGLLAPLFFSSIAAYIWWGGYVSWLMLKKKRVRPWVVKWLTDPGDSFLDKARDTKIYHVYLAYTIAWMCNMFWAVSALLIYPGKEVSTYEPIVGDIILSHIGIVVFELIMFFILIGLLSSFTRER